MDLNNQQLERERYKREDGQVIVEVAINDFRQLFNERDPAPFRNRDLDEDFASYVVGSVQEFPLKTAMKLRIIVDHEIDFSLDRNIISDSIKSYFFYESKRVQAHRRKQKRISRFFLLIGFLTLFFCLGTVQFLYLKQHDSTVIDIIREGLVIIGWVAMWRPIESILYDWFPLYEEQKYFDKIADLPIEIVLKKTL